MPIHHGVGDGAPNLHDDAVVVQALLTLNRPSPLPALAVDGTVNDDTRAAICEFQQRLLGIADGRIEPGSATMAALRKGLLQAGVSRDGLPDGPLGRIVLRGIVPAAAPDHIAMFLPHLAGQMPARTISPGLRQAHFLAQAAYETSYLEHTEEQASGDVHEGRHDLGNIRPGDGPRYKARGLLRLVGRAAYAAYGRAIRRDLLATPERVAAEPDLAVDAGCWFWEAKGLNALADADNLEAITRRIDPSLRGFAQRQAHLRRAKFFLMP